MFLFALKKYCHYGVQFIVVVTMICVFVPFAPNMPSSGLDSSWAAGMAHAAAHHFDFGRQIVFTFGPYTSVYTGYYHAQFDIIWLAAGVLGLCYGFALLYLAGRRNTLLLIGFTLFFAGAVYLRDALFFSYPLLVGLCGYRLLSKYNSYTLRDDARQAKQKRDTALILALLIPFGLLPLVKGSLLVLCVAVVGLMVLLAMAYRRWWLVLAIIIVPSVSLLVFWLLAGQKTVGLALYVWHMLPIISGYSGAMAAGGKLPETVGFIVVSGLLLTMLVRAKDVVSHQRLFLLVLLFVYLLLAFKGGFVRHDVHATTAGAGLVLAVIALVFLAFKQRFALLLLPAFLVWAYIDATHVKTSTADVYKRLKITYKNASHGINIRLNHPEHWQASYQQSLDRIHAQSQIPALNGSVDIYPHHQASLLASGNHWQPRPTFQSYSAYTPSLLAMNKAHLQGKSAPDYVVFKIDTIDNRLPMLADGSSWPVLLSHYKLLGKQGDFLYLQRKNVVSGNRAVSDIVQKTQTLTGQLGQSLKLPISAELITARIVVKPSLLGRLLGTFYKSSPLHIRLLLANGEQKDYRFIAGMGASTFVLSPLVDTTEAFAELYQKASPLLQQQQVVSITLQAKSAAWLWQSNFSVTLNPAE